MMRIFLCVLVLFVALAAGRSTAADDAPASSDDNLALLVDVLGQNADPRVPGDILKGMNAAHGGPAAGEGAGELAGRAKLLDSPSSRRAGRRDDARGRVRRRGGVRLDAQNAARPRRPGRRAGTALSSLLAAHDAKLAPSLQTLVADPVLRARALARIGRVRRPADAEGDPRRLRLARHPARNAALATLAGRKAYATTLIAAVEGGAIPRRDLTAATVRQLRDLGDKEVDAFVAKGWGVARQSSEEKTKEIARWKSILTDEKLKSAPRRPRPRDLRPHLRPVPHDVRPGRQGRPRPHRLQPREPRLC